jgi:hypothetical protein
MMALYGVWIRGHECWARLEVVSTTIPDGYNDPFPAYEAYLAREGRTIYVTDDKDTAEHVAMGAGDDTVGLPGTGYLWHGDLEVREIG